MSELETAAPPVEGVPSENGSQGSGESPQGQPETKETGSVQVENGPQSTSSQEGTRPKPSEFYLVRKLESERKTLLKTVTDLTQRLDSFMKGNTAPPKANEPVIPTLEQYFKNPVAFQLEREKLLREELKKELLEKEFPEYIEKTESQKQAKARELEALELIFPKGSSSDPLEKRVASNAAKAERIMQILVETGLDQVSVTDPIKATATAIKLYENEVKAQKAANPNVPKKGQMVSTATGTPQGAGGQKKMTLEEIKTEADNMRKQAQENPQLRNDDKFKERWNGLKEELTKLTPGK